MKVFVGASSSENMPKKYVEDCTSLLEKVLKDNDLVFGAYNKGLMGVSYNIAKKNKRLVIGICPEVYKKSLEDIECDKEEVTSSIVESTNKIYKNSDIVIMLPGGFGSIFEFFTGNYCKICNELDIPIILYNSCGYYDKLLDFIKDAVDNKIINEKELGKYFVANNIEEVISYMKKINKSVK